MISTGTFILPSNVLGPTVLALLGSVWGRWLGERRKIFFFLGVGLSFILFFFTLDFFEVFGFFVC